jgi:hypothetical protein
MNKIHVEGTRCCAKRRRKIELKILFSPRRAGRAHFRDAGNIGRNLRAAGRDFDEMGLLRVEILSGKNRFARFQDKGERLVILNPSLLLGAGDDRLSSTKVVLDFMAKKCRRRLRAV